MKLRNRSWAWPATTALLFLVACGDKNPENQIASARAKLVDNDPAYAIVELKSVLQQRPDSPEARFLLGQALLKSDNPAAAVVEFRKAMALHYPDSQVTPALARAMLAQNESRKLVDEFAQLSLPDPVAQASLKTSVGEAYAALSDTTNATAAADAALQAAPDHAPAMLLLARLAAAAGKFDQATAIIQRAEKVAPSDPNVWVTQGDVALLARGDAPAAIVFYEKALGLDASNVRARSNLASLLIRRGDLDGAEAQMVQLRKTRSGNLQTAFLDVQLAFARGDLKRATEGVQLVLKVVPDNVTALQLAGRIAASNGSLDAAERAYAKALSLAPNLADGRRQLAIIHLRRGEPERALETIAPLIGERGSDAAALAIAAEAQMVLGAHAEARKLFARAVKINPQDGRSRTKEALANLALGNTATALSDLSSIAATDKGTLADLALVNVAIEAKDFDRAMRGIEAMESKRPRQASTADLRGRLLLLMRKEPEARKSFEQALAINPSYLSAANSLAQLDLLAKNPDGARKRFEAMLVAEPNNLGAMLALAALRTGQGAPATEVVDMMNKAIAANPSAAAPRLILLEHYLRSKNHESALATARQADAAIHDNPEILDALGRALAASGDREQAIASFQKLASLQPRSTQAPLRLAGVYLTGNQYVRAAESFRRALELDPASLAAQQGLIETLLADRRGDEALAFAKSLQRRWPDDVRGYGFEGRVHVFRGAYADALETYRSALKRFPMTDLATKVHATLIAMKQPKEAEQFNAQWLTQHPKDIAFIAFAGDSAMAREDFAIAEQHFRRFLEFQPENPRALNNIALLMLKQQKPGAVAYAERANRLRANSPELMDTLASALAAEQQTDKALALQKRAIEIAPDDATLRLNLSKLYIQAGMLAPARTELEALAKLGAGFAGQDEVTQLLKVR